MSKINWIPKQAWLGSGAGLRNAIDATTMAQDSVSVEGLGGNFKLSMENDTQEDSSRLVQILGSVGVVNIQGDLTDTDSFMNYYFGMVSYTEIRAAIIEVANDPEVETILLNIKSAGGSATGAFELADFIGKIDSTVKRVESLANGLMASAAYLLAAPTSKIHATKSSIVGSVGVISVHREVTEALKSRGIKVNIIRSGKYKALVNPYEKLSDLAREEVQSKSDKLYNLFISAVSEGRDTPLAEVDARMAQGKEFLGIDALRVGLVDNITDIDTLIGELSDRTNSQAMRNLSSHTNLGQLSEGTDMKPAKLSKENQAKLASGVPLSQLGLEPVGDDPKQPTKVDVDLKLNPTDEGVESGSEGKPELKSDPTKEPAEDSKAGSKDNAGSTDLISYLKEANKDLVQDNAKLSAKLEKLGADSEETNVAVVALEKIVRMSADRLSCGLGNTSPDHESLSGLLLASAFNRLNSTFEERMPIAGKASSQADDSQGENSVNTNHRAAVNAASIN